MKKKEVITKLISLIFMIFAIQLILCNRVEALSQQEYRDKINAILNTYENKVFWDYSCKSCGNYSQTCYAFASYCQNQFYGVCPKCGSEDNGVFQWLVSGDIGSARDLRVGDVIRFYNAPYYNHSIVIINISGDNVTYMDGNGSGDSVVHKNTVNFSQIKSWLNTSLIDGEYGLTAYLMREKGNEVTTIDGDNENPVLSEAFIDPTSMNGLEYKVCVKASDNVGITKIPVMSWATSNSSNKKEYRATYNSSSGYYKATIKASDFNGDKGLYKSNVYVYDEAGNGVAKGLSKVPMNTKIVTTLGNFKARIVLKRDKNYAITTNGTSQNSNVMLGEKSNSDESQVWQFIKKSDGKSYEIVNVASNRALDITNAEDADGANVAIHTRNNSNAQTFYIMEYNGGYRLVPKCTSDLKAIDLADDKAEAGHNIDLYNICREDNGAQIWLFEDATISLGDVNEDEQINSRDAKLALQYYVGKTKLTENQKLAGDVNKDGEINSRDAKLILQYYVGKIKEF